MFAYKPNFIPSSIVLIGAGGTGSRLVGPLAQLIRTCLNKYNPQAWMQSLPLYIIDGDRVEEKNLARQCFIQRDVGYPKAAVVASRYSNAYGIPIYPCTDFVKVGNNLQFVGAPTGTQFSFHNSLVILAVDSAAARREILSVIARSSTSGLINVDPALRNCFIIDAGNEDNFGQVRFFTMDILSGGRQSIEALKKRTPKAFPQLYEVPYIPFDPFYYANLGESASEKSCVDLPQTLAINNMMAALILSVTQNFLLLKPMTYNCVRYGLDGSMATEYNTPRGWYEKNVNDAEHQNLKGMELALRGCRQNTFSAQILAVESAREQYTKAGLRVTPSGDLEPITPPLQKTKVEEKDDPQPVPTTPVERKRRRVEPSQPPADSEVLTEEVREIPELQVVARPPVNTPAEIPPLVQGE